MPDKLELVAVSLGLFGIAEFLKSVNAINPEGSTAIRGVCSYTRMVYSLAPDLTQFDVQVYGRLGCKMDRKELFKGGMTVHMGKQPSPLGWGNPQLG